MIYLLTQIFLCLLIAFLLGLLLGWLLWGRKRAQLVQGDGTSTDADRRRIASLEADLAACRDAAAAHTAEFHTQAPVTVAAAAAGASTAGLFGPVATVTVDDLKLISGVGPVIEKQLAGIGITTFRQIAILTDDDIQTVQEAINFFPGRIQQEDWRSQAATLHREKYNDAA